MHLCIDSFCIVPFCVLDSIDLSFKLVRMGMVRRLRLSVQIGRRRHFGLFFDIVDGGICSPTSAILPPSVGRNDGALMITISASCLDRLRPGARVVPFHQTPLFGILGALAPPQGGELMLEWTSVVVIGLGLPSARQ